jgi:tetratricopeptide (TPR) repeat protein
MQVKRRLAYQSWVQYRESIQYLQQQLVIIREINDRYSVANTLGNLGAAYQSLGQYQEAIAHLQEQLAIAQEIGDILALANAFGNLGIT